MVSLRTILKSDLTKETAKDIIEKAGEIIKSGKKTKPAKELFATNLTNYCFFYKDNAGVSIRYIL